MSIDLDLFYDVDDSDSNKESATTPTKGKARKKSAKSQTFDSFKISEEMNSKDIDILSAPSIAFPQKKFYSLGKTSDDQHKNLAEIDVEEMLLLQIKKRKEQERLEEDAELDRRLFLVQKMKSEQQNRSCSYCEPITLESTMVEDSADCDRRSTLINKTSDPNESSENALNNETSLVSAKTESFVTDKIVSTVVVNSLQETLNVRSRTFEDVSTPIERKSIFKNAAKLIKEHSQRLVSIVGKAAQKVVKSDDSSLSEDYSLDSDTVKYKSRKKNCNVLKFEKTRMVQLLEGHHVGSIWAVEFSRCGIFMATGGQDGVIHVWVAREMSAEMRNNRNDTRDTTSEEFRSRLFYSRSSLFTDTSSISSGNVSEFSLTGSEPSVYSASTVNTTDRSSTSVMFDPVPFISYKSHESDVLCLSWSRTHFLVSSSMDMTVRLFNVFHGNCLCCFRHGDCVPSVAFHPQDERYFVSGSLEGIVRIWNIPDKKVAMWNRVDGGSLRMITAVSFCRNGRIVVVGTYSGTCLFYEASKLQYSTQIQVKGSGKNTCPKITGIIQMPHCSNKVLVSSNDSRIRLYDLRDLSLTCKYKGGLNCSSQIRASFNHSGRFIICGSENHWIYFWKTNRNLSSPNFGRRDKNNQYERVKAHVVTVSCTAFAPKLEYFMKNRHSNGEVFVSADVLGNIKVFKVRWSRMASS